MPSLGARSAAQSCSWSAGLPLIWVSTCGTGSPVGGGTPSGIGVPSCHEQLEAISSTVAPITATARSQSTGNTGLPQTPYFLHFIVPRPAECPWKPPGVPPFLRTGKRYLGVPTLGRAKPCNVPRVNYEEAQGNCISPGPCR